MHSLFHVCLHNKPVSRILKAQQLFPMMISGKLHNINGDNKNEVFFFNNITPSYLFAQEMFEIILKKYDAI